jgi:hypothetical protein
MTPNIAAAAMNTMVKHDRQNNATQMALPFLLEVAGAGILGYRNPSNNMTLYAIQDVLFSLSLLQNKTAMIPLANTICDIFANDLNQTITTLHPRRMVEIVEAVMALQLNHTKLLDAACDRLAKPDALKKLKPAKICQGLSALSFRKEFSPATVGFLRRLRKQTVRQELGPHYVTMAITAAGRLLGSCGTAEEEEEVRVMAYTLVNRELRRPIQGNTTTLVTQLSLYQISSIAYAISLFGWNDSPILTDIYEAIDRRLEQEFSIRDASLILKASLSFEVNRTMISTLGDTLLQWVQQSRPVNRKDFVAVLTSALRLLRRDTDNIIEPFARAATEVMESKTYEDFLLELTEVEIAGLNWFFAEATSERKSNVCYSLGKRLQTLASDRNLKPESVVMAFQYAVKMFGKSHPDVLQPYLDTVKHLCTVGTSNFLSTITSTDLAFLVESLSRAKFKDEATYVEIAKMAIKTRFAEECSPSASRRIMSAFANAVTQIETSKLQGYQVQLFDSLGANLLSTQVKPYEAADALYVYAKVGYLSDMGVFDQLSALVSEQLENLSIRAVAQCLWACGKMYMWDSKRLLSNELCPNDMHDTPYLEGARSFAEYLQLRISELSAIDLAQSLWAMAKLGICDDQIVDVFAKRAKQVIGESGGCEIANIVWGLSKVGYHNKELLKKLSRRVLDADVQLSTKEAACVLFALGYADAREDDVFTHLGDVLMGQVDSVSAQAIANALWAHNQVGKLAPPKLLESWASSKLGLVGLQPIDPEYEPGALM